MPRTSIETRLPALHAHYTALMNAAVAAGRMDLVEDLADAYQDEALELLLALEAEDGSRSDRRSRSSSSGPAAVRGARPTRRCRRPLRRSAPTGTASPGRPVRAALNDPYR